MLATLALTIPHILTSVCEDLSNTEIWHCSHVSQTWLDLFSPLLWRTVLVEEDSPPFDHDQGSLISAQDQEDEVDPRHAVLARNAQHIRCLKIYSRQTANVLTAIPCTQLKELLVWDEYDGVEREVEDYGGEEESSYGSEQGTEENLDMEESEVDEEEGEEEMEEDEGGDDGEEGDGEEESQVSYEWDTEMVDQADEEEEDQETKDRILLSLHRLVHALTSTLNSNPGLKTLEIKFSSHHAASCFFESSSLVEALARHGSLTVVKLDFGHDLARDNLTSLMRHLPKSIVRFQLGLSTSQDQEERESELMAGAEMEGKCEEDHPVYEHLTRIDFEYTNMMTAAGIQSALLPLLRHCPRLAHLSFPRFAERHVKDVVSVLAKNCPRLKILDLSAENQWRDGDHVTFVQELHNLTDVSVAIGEHAVVQNIQSRFLSGLIDSSAKTIECLSVSSTGNLPGPEILRCLTSFPKLKELRLYWMLQDQVSVGATLEELLRPGWVCESIEEMSITIMDPRLVTEDGRHIRTAMDLTTPALQEDIDEMEEQKEVIRLLIQLNQKLRGLSKLSYLELYWQVPPGVEHDVDLAWRFMLPLGTRQKEWILQELTEDDLEWMRIEGPHPQTHRS